MATYEGRWRCSSCGKENLGLAKGCSSCGNPHDKDEEYYLPGNEPAITDPEKLKKAQAGPDWYCRYCYSGSPGNTNKCENCGADRGDAEVHEVRDYALGEVPDEDPKEKARRERRQPRPSPRSEPKPDSEPASQHTYRRNPYPHSNDQVMKNPFPKKKVLGIGIASLVVILIGVFCYLFFTTHEVPITLTSVSWERSIGIERWQEVEEEDWSVPSSGREISRRKKIHHYDKVPDGYDIVRGTKQVPDGTEKYVCGKTSNGNGTFSDTYCTRTKYKTVQTEEKVQKYKDVPVKKDWYTYMIFRWVKNREYNSAGMDKNPYWPKTVVGKDGFKERECCRQQDYTATFTDPEGENYNRNFDLDRWSGLEVKGVYTGKVNAFGVLMDIETR